MNSTQPWILIVFCDWCPISEICTCSSWKWSIQNLTGKESLPLNFSNCLPERCPENSSFLAIIDWLNSLIESNAIETQVTKLCMKEIEKIYSIYINLCWWLLIKIHLEAKKNRLMNWLNFCSLTTMAFDILRLKCSWRRRVVRCWLNKLFQSSLLIKSWTVH